MWKSFFLAFGFFLLIMGVETLVVQKFVMASGSRVPRIVSSMTDELSTPAWNNPAQAGTTNVRKREIRTREWMPWSLLAAGAITVMYTLSLPQRSPGGTP